MSHLSTSGLDRTFAGKPPVHALSSVSVEVASGALLAVLGPSGCGKTTLLRTIAGLERPDRGEVRLGDRLLDGPGVHVAPERRAIGLVPQEGALFPHLDVAGNVGFGLNRLPRRERAERVGALLELVGLAGMERRRPHQLSGGQQQRVALARALAPSPEVVLLDEPFSALDTGLRVAVREEVSATLRARSTTAVLVTHDQVEAMTMADTLAVMRGGEIVQIGPPSEVYHRPVDTWTARFLGDAVMVAGHRSGDHRVTGPLGEVDLSPDFAHHTGSDVTVFCRPEQVRPVGAGDDGAEAVVLGVRFLGPDVMVTLSIQGCTASARWPSSLLPAAGDVVRVAVTGPVLAYPPEPLGSPWGDSAHQRSPAVADADADPAGSAAR
jgi:iron(III) transport system ATP-binding protein